ncbi:MAG: hypothetical protein JST66_12240 [Bacteroidetes bacterium]|nr:hypothetical protein [Bacteroidota bacterium]
MRNLLPVVAFVSVGSLQAQMVTIPDPQFRAELNQRMPGLVVGTQIPVNNDAIVPSSLSLTIDWSPCDLTGLEYLQGVITLDLRFVGTVDLVTLPVLPPSTVVFKATAYPAGEAWPVMPPPTRYLEIADITGTDLPTRPDGFYSIYLSNAPNVTALPPMDPVSISTLTLRNTGITAVVLGTDLIYQNIYLIDCPALAELHVGGMPEDPGYPEVGVAIDNAPLLTSVEVGHATVIDLSRVPSLTDLGPLPDSLQMLFVRSAGQLGLVPELPVALDRLILDSLPIASLPALPARLSELALSQLPLVALPALNDSLASLSLALLPALTMAPVLPDSLERLNLMSLPLVTVMPELPSSIRYMDLRELPLVSLDTLPESLEQLGLFDLDIPGLPTLPPGLRILELYDLVLTGLPALPDALTYLIADHVPLACLPYLPEGLISLDMMGTDLVCQPNVPPGSNQLFPLCTVLNSSCPRAAAVVKGTVYWDRNENALRDMGEPGLPDVTLVAEPAGYMTATDMNGDYAMALPIGAHTLRALPGPFTLDLAPEQIELEISALDTVITSADIGSVLDTIHPDLSITNWWAWAPRPGFSMLHVVSMHNAGTASYGVEARLTTDPATAFVGCDVPPTTDGPDLVWILDTLGVGETRIFTCFFQVEGGISLGTELVMPAAIMPLEEDVDTTNNRHVDRTVVVGSFDPNDKQVSPSTMFPDEAVTGREVEYLVRFQNTGTASALRVVITDTLSPDLDPLTFRFLGSSHPCTWTCEGGVLHFVFDPIDLPDSTSNEPGSHGAVLFHIATRPGLLPGTTVPNTANIYFDLNEPVITDVCLLTVDQVTPMVEGERTNVRLYPVPAQDMLYLEQDGSWNGAQAMLMDARGATVAVVPVSATSTAIALGDRAPGLYLLRLEQGGRRLIFRVVVE